MPDTIYDVAVIGAGVVGAAVARELARYDLRCVLIEAGEDVGAGTSKANTAILHTGFDGKPDYLETRMVRRGNQLLGQYVAEAGIPVEPLGALLIAWDQDQLEALPHIVETAYRNGSPDVNIISTDELYRREPKLGAGALGAVSVPREAIICPFTVPLAYATQAVINGVALRLNAPVQSVERTPAGDFIVRCPQETITCRYLVNAAGLYADAINRMLGYDEFGVIPRRGQLIVYDKMARGLVNHILLPVPSKMGKGVLISPTVFGNVMLGPTAENLTDRTATETTAEGIATLLEKGRRILPDLPHQEVTAMYAGLRASTQHDDYQIYLHERYLCLGGIRSTGLSASLAIAENAAERLAEAGLTLARKAEFQPVKMPNLGEAFPRPYQLDEMIRSNPDYGRIVCHCERVTRGEILDAAHSAIPARSPDALRRRTRAQMGRCQGFFCAAEVAALLAEATDQPLRQVIGVDAP